MGTRRRGRCGRIAPGTRAAGPAIAALTEALRAGPPQIRSAAVRALGEFGAASASATPDLIRMLREAPEPDPFGGDAAVALGCIAQDTPSSDEALAALIEAIQTKSSIAIRCHLCVAEIRAQVRDRDPQAPRVTKAPEASVRQAAEETLAEITKSEGHRDR